MQALADLRNPVLFFDGACNLCNTSVQQVIKRDKKRTYRFASLQSNFGQAFLTQYQLPTDTFNTFLLFEEGKIYTKSTAALKVLRGLGGIWSVFYYLFIIVPPVIRDGVYDWVARNRYKWFGKREACWLPTPELKSLFYE